MARLEAYLLLKMKAGAALKVGKEEYKFIFKNDIREINVIGKTKEEGVLKASFFEGGGIMRGECFCSDVDYCAIITEAGLTGVIETSDDKSNEIIETNNGVDNVKLK
jgi:hypothetical protein